MPKAKICFVAQDIYPYLKPENSLNFIGGAELQQLLLGKELAARGYQVSYITMNHGQPEVEQVGPFRVISTFRPGEGIPGLRFFYPRLSKIRRALKKSDADIYYVRCANFILAPVVSHARAANKKVIYSAASEPDFDKERLRLSVPWRDNRMYFWGLKRADAIVAQNRIQQQILKKHFHREAVIIHNGFQKQKQPFTSGEEILWVGSMRPLKKPEVFLEIAQNIPEEKFVLVGGIAFRKSSDRRVIHNYILQKSKQIPNLELTGYLSFREVEQRFDRAKLFINTSEYEGFPNTFLQAWSRGIPVISFVDPDNLIATHRLGFVVKTPEEMIRKVRDFSAGRLTVSNDYIRYFFETNLTIEKVVDRYENLFGILLKK